MIVVLGKSAGVITMICDNLESIDDFRNIKIINNLNLHDGIEFHNDKFKIQEVVESKIDPTTDTVFVLGGYNPMAKEELFKLFGIPAEYFLNIIHASAQISSMAKLGSGLMINSLASIAAHASIGNFVTVNRHASIGHHTIIGDFVTISPAATICGGVKIGNKTYIGAGAVVRDGITIGSGCVIGAGSVVVKNVPDGIAGYGNPFKIKA